MIPNDTDNADQGKIVRPVPEEDIERLIDITFDAYPGFVENTEEARKKSRERLDRQLQDPRISLHGFYLDSKLLGGIRLFDYTMNLFGTKVLAGGGGTLAVSLLHKKEHVAKELMLYYFRHYRERKAPLAVLWPFRHDFYRRMGCGYGGKMHQYRLRPRQLPTSPDRKHVRFLSRDDLKLINACYNRYVDRTPGMIEETELGHRIVFEQRKKDRWVGFESDGRLAGYLVFNFERTESRNQLDNSIHVTQLIYETPTALSAMMTFLQTQLDQISLIIIDTPEDDFHHLLPDPRNDSNHLIPSVYHEIHTSGAGIMYRVLSIPHLIEALAKRDFDGKDLSILLRVRDSFLPENAGEYLIGFVGGSARILNTGKADIEMCLDISDFSSLIMGSVTVRSLYNYSRLTLSNDDLLDRLHRLFAVDQKPVCMTDF